MIEDSLSRELFPNPQQPIRLLVMFNLTVLAQTLKGSGQTTLSQHIHANRKPSTYAAA